MNNRHHPRAAATSRPRCAATPPADALPRAALMIAALLIADLSIGTPHALAAGDDQQRREEAALECAERADDEEIAAAERDDYIAECIESLLAAAAD